MSEADRFDDETVLARRQHAAGRLTANERLAVLLDEHSFEALQPPGQAAVLAGQGAINGRRVFVFAQQGGAGSALPEGGALLDRLAQRALQLGAPLIGLYDPSAGDAPPSGPAGQAWRSQARAVSRVPQLAVILGDCVGADAIGPALADWVFMVRRNASVVLSGPGRVRAVRHEDLDLTELGGAATQASAGQVHGVFEHEVAALLAVRRFFDFLPMSRHSAPPMLPGDDPPDRREPALQTLVPAEPGSPYDMMELVSKLVDAAEFFELQPEYAGNVLAGLARVDGATVGIVANQPRVLAGCLDAAAAAKAARLMRFCDAFALPLVMLADLPGFLPGAEQEHGGLAWRAAELLRVWAACSCGRVTVVTRRAGGWAGGMFIGDVNLAWPSAVAYEDDALKGEVPAWIDAVIAPEATRVELCRALSGLRKARDSRAGRT